MADMESVAKPGRNAPCPCGSGRKYKKCCESKAARLSAPVGNSRSLVERALQFHQQGNLEQAENLYREALNAEPGNADALHLCGVIAYQKGWNEQAEGMIREAIAIHPSNAEYYNNLGNVLQDKGQADGAAECYRRAVRIRPDYPEAYNNLGTIMREEYRFEESMECYKKALLCRSDYPEAYNNLGNLFKEMNRPEEAVRCYDKALSLCPDYLAARYHRSLALLQKGDYLQGWRDYEWRWYASREAATWKREFRQPQWQGEKLDGRTILLHSEQGFGDSIQAVRYAPLVAQRGGKVIVECQPELVRLFGAVAGVETVACHGGPLPPFDVHCPLMSLPLAFNTTLETVPSGVPYLVAHHDLCAKWAERLKPGGALKVGIAWGGSARNMEDPRRSLPPEELAPLAGMKGIRFYSLQKGMSDSRKSNLPAALNLIDLAEDLQDFADTAAMMANLDLVISVDTSVAHLAGAMGLPVWLLSKYGSDWRWLLDREDSPWYPSMRIFRQRAPGNWNEVMERVAKVLKGQAHFFFGVTAIPEDRYDDAKRCFQDAIMADQDNAEYHYSLGVALHNQGRLEDAAESYWRAVSLKPDHDRATENLIVLLMDEQFVDHDYFSPIEPRSERFFPGSAEISRLIRQMLEAAPTIGRSAALAGLDEATARLNLGAVDCIHLLLLMRLLHMAGWYDDCPDLPRPFSPRHFIRLITDMSLQQAMKMRLLPCMDYHVNSSRQWNRMLFEEYVVPTMPYALNNGSYSLARDMDFLTVLSYAQQPYTEEHWAYCASKLRGPLVAAGKLLRQSATALPGCNDTDSLPVMGFMTEWQINGISADNLMTNIIKGLMGMDPGAFRPIVYVSHSAEITPDMKARLEAANIPVVVATSTSMDLLDSLSALKERMAHDEVAVLTFMGVSEAYAVLAGAMQLAPVQIYMTVGFRHVTLPSYWDGYYAGFSAVKATERYNGQLWRMGPAWIPDICDDSIQSNQDALEAERLRRERFGRCDILFATVCRPPKLANPEYMDTIARILKANPGAVFLWFGEKEFLTVRRMMEERGISDRCHFMGWLRKGVVARLIDIHLDGFPFPNGHSMLESMYAGKAFVWMDTPEVRKGGCSCSLVMPLLEGRIGTEAEQAEMRAIFTHSESGENLAPAAVTQDEYVALAQRLIDDREFRAAVGNAGRLFVRRYFSDPTYGSRVFAEHCLEIIAEKAGRVEGCTAS